MAAETGSRTGTLLAVAVILLVGATLLAIRLSRPAGESGLSAQRDDDVYLAADTPGREYPSLPGDLRTIPEWISRNAPFDIASAFAPVPAEDNAAPGYLDALYEFAPNEMAPCVSPADRRARGRALKERHARLVFLQSRDPKTVTPGDRSAMIAEYGASFEKLARAQKRKLCIFEHPPGIITGAPHALAARGAAALSAWRTELHLAEGRIDAAVDDVEVGLRLGRDIRPRGNLLCQVASMAIDSRILEGCVAQILNSRGLEFRHCDRLRDILARHASDGIDPLSEGLRYEYAFSRDVFHSLELREDLGEKLGWPGQSYGQMLVNSAKFLGREEGRDGNELAQQIDQDLARMTAADFAVEVELLNRSFQALMERALRRERRLDEAFAEVQAVVQNSIIQKDTAATYDVTTEAFRRCRTKIGGFQCLVALRRWKLEHGEQLPADLLTVCNAARISEIPLDEYSGLPLQGADVDGEFVIVSAGPNRTNASGPGDGQPGMRPGDWIFRLGPVQ